MIYKKMVANRGGNMPSKSIFEPKYTVTAILSYFFYFAMGDNFRYCGPFVNKEHASTIASESLRRGL